MVTYDPTSMIRFRQMLPNGRISSPWHCLLVSIYSVS